MAEEKLLTVRDVSQFLGISEKEVVDLAESGALPAYKVGGVYLRFKRDQILDFKKRAAATLPKIQTPKDYPLPERISDFLYFNDFYLFAILIILFLVVVIVRGY